MRKRTVTLRLLCLFIACAAVSGTSSANEPARSVTIVDIDGTTHHLGRESSARAVGVIFLSIDCPISNGYLPEMNAIHTAMYGKGVRLYGVISSRHVSYQQIREFREKYSIKFPLIGDQSQRLQSSFEATHTPHAFVLDRKGREAYRGRIDNRYSEVGRNSRKAGQRYFLMAIARTLHDQSVLLRETEPVGCRLETPTPTSTDCKLTFGDDVAEIVQKHCVECHRPGQSAPFSLLTCNDVSAHALQVAEVVQNGLMPPWKPAANFGHFRDRRGLTENEISTLVEWSRSEKARGPEQALIAPAKADGWKLGRPDRVFTMPKPFRIPAGNRDYWQHFVFPSRLTEDRLISAIEFRPGNARVVHHASFYVDNSGAARRLDAKSPEPGYGGFPGPGFDNWGSLLSWLPGMTPRPHPGRYWAATPEVLRHRSGNPLSGNRQAGIRPFQFRNSLRVWHGPAGGRRVADSESDAPNPGRRRASPSSF